MKRPSLKFAFGLFIVVATIALAIFAFWYTKYEADQSNKDLREETENVSSYPTESQGESEETQNQIQLTVEAPNSEKASYTATFEQGTSAFGLLEELNNKDDSFDFKYDEFDFGVFITAINGFKPDSTKQFWKFQANGKDAQVGVADYEVKQGDQLNFVVDNIQ